MLDIKFIADNPERVKAAARKKRMTVDVDGLLESYQRYKTARQQFEQLQAEINAASKRIPTLPDAEKRAAVEETKAKRAEQDKIKTSLQPLEDDYNARLLRMPNIPDDAVPEGESDKDNVELRRVGTPPKFAFTPRSHLELGELHDMLDAERGVKIAGARNYFLKNAGAMLELSIMRMALDMLAARGFTPMLVPHLVHYNAMMGTAYFPGGEEQAYHIEKDQLYLIGTSEVSLCSYHYDEILTEKQMPLRYAGWSSCYRREAGAAGKDTKGLYRIHQFQKIEQVVICEADEETSRREHEALLANSEAVLRMLELPYRVVMVCGGDLGQPQVKKYDIETWMPSRDAYGETHSCSMMGDFQARRLKLRYKNKDGKTVFCHTLNNTAAASPRILIPLLECHQRQDGSIYLPKALRPYMGGLEELKAK